MKVQKLVSTGLVSATLVFVPVSVEGIMVISGHSRPGDLEPSIGITLIKENRDGGYNIISCFQPGADWIKEKNGIDIKLSPIQVKVISSILVPDDASTDKALDTKMNLNFSWEDGSPANFLDDPMYPGSPRLTFLESWRSIKVHPEAETNWIDPVYNTHWLKRFLEPSSASNLMDLNNRTIQVNNLYGYSFLGVESKTPVNGLDYSFMENQLANLIATNSGCTPTPQPSPTPPVVTPTPAVAPIPTPVPLLAPEPEKVPEPSSFWAIFLALVALFLIKRRP
jgi:hypothetical protein